jgi:hypothetical protein
MIHARQDEDFDFWRMGVMLARPDVDEMLARSREAAEKLREMEDD